MLQGASIVVEIRNGVEDNAGGLMLIDSVTEVRVSIWNVAR